MVACCRSMLVAILALVGESRPAAQSGVLRCGRWVLFLGSSLIIGLARLHGQQPAPWGGCSASATVPNVESERRSLYVPMPDQVRLAVDVLLPRKSTHARLPTVLRATRYEGLRGMSYDRISGNSEIELDEAVIQ